MSRSRIPQNEAAKGKEREALDAALRILIERGAEHVTPSRVAHRSRLSPQWVAMYLGSQEELLDRLVEACMEEIHRVLMAPRQDLKTISRLLAVEYGPLVALAYMQGKGPRMQDMVATRIEGMLVELTSDAEVEQLRRTVCGCWGGLILTGTQRGEDRLATQGRVIEATMALVAAHRARVRRAQDPEDEPTPDRRAIERRRMF